MSKAVTLDIENMGILGWSWGIYEQNIIHIEHPQHLLTVAWKWLDKNKVETVSLLDNPNYKKEPHNDKIIAEVMWNVLDDCDTLIGQNIDAFDVKMINSMFMRHGFKPPSPYKTVDTLKVAKKKGKFTSNKLDDLGNTLGIGRKVKHEGFQMWLDCDNGDVKAYKRMLKYNKQDVLLTEKLYLNLLPWVDNHPPLNILNSKADGCPNCGSEDITLGAHYITSRTNRYQYARCSNCGKTLKVRLPDRLEKPTYVSV
jgi:predicted RNA-binding Zn-ribbon protein involved in translation (DUF1610 family)